MAETKYSECELLLNLVSKDRDVSEPAETRLVSVLSDYLVVTLGAQKPEAIECVNRGLDILRDRIKHKTVEPGRKAIKELLVLVQNQYFDELRKVDRDGSAVFSEMLVNEADVQIEKLASMDKPENMEFCLSTLDNRSRDLLEFTFTPPIPSQLKISQKFGISPAVIRSRRSSIIERLTDCIHRGSVKMP
jgi:hypothetical protein